MPSATRTIFTARGSAPVTAASALVDAGGVEQVALVQHDQVGAGDLILEHFLDRVVVLERGVGGALAGQRLEVGGDAPFRDAPRRRPPPRRRRR